jgi:hypothetical protein
MALTSTTLAKACVATDTRLKLTSTTGIVKGMRLKVNDEYVTVTGDIDDPSVPVERGQEGTIARAHGILSLVVYGYPYDFQVPLLPQVYTYGISGALTVGAGLHRLAKAGVAAMTLRAPRADEEGLTMLLVATSAYAHTVTLDSGVFNNFSNEKVLVFANAIGNCIELQAVQGYWCVTLNKNVTLPSVSASSSGSSSASVSASSSASKSASVSPSSS